MECMTIAEIFYTTIFSIKLMYDYNWLRSILRGAKCEYHSNKRLYNPSNYLLLPCVGRKKFRYYLIRVVLLRHGDRIFSTVRVPCQIQFLSPQLRLGVTYVRV